MTKGFAALRHPDFRRLLAAQTISGIGDSCYYLVILFMANLATNGDSFQLGIVGMVTALPYILFGPLAGRMVDRRDRKALMVFSDAASFVIMLGLTITALYTALPPVWLLAVIGFLMSTVNSFFFPARSASLPRLVPTEDLMEANSVSMMAQQITYMVGLSFNATFLAGLYKAAPDWFLPLAAAINAVTFLASALILMRLPTLIPLREEQEQKPPHVLDDLREGVQAIRSDGFFGPALAVSFLISLFLSGFFIVYMAVNKQWFRNDFGDLAWIELAFAVAMTATTAFVGTLTIRWVAWSFSLSTIGTGLMVAAMGVSQNYWVFLVFNLLCGLTVPFSWIPLMTYMQAAFADELRGRVSSAWSMVNQSAQPLGNLVAGWLLTLAGPSNLFYIMGIGMIFAGGVGLFSRRYRAAEMPA